MYYVPESVKAIIFPPNRYSSKQLFTKIELPKKIKIPNTVKCKSEKAAKSQK